jgi:hypothetical protein
MKKIFDKRYRLQVGIIMLAVIMNLSFVSIAQGRSETGHTDYVVVLAMEKIAILPFSDRSHQVFSSALAWKGNQDIVSYIEDCFKSRKFPVISGQRIERLLLSQGIIKPFKDLDNPASPEWSIIHSNYSLPLTKEILKDVIARQGDTVALSRGKIIELAKKLNVDAFVRGVILDVNPKPLIDTRNIMERGIADPFGGILPFQAGKSSHKSACYAVASRYENGLPSLKKVKPMALLVEVPDEKIKEAIEVIIFIQNAETGSVIWSNSFKIRRYPSGSDVTRLKGFDAELKKKINLAMDELFSVLYCYKGLWLLVEEKKVKE